MPVNQVFSSNSTLKFTVIHVKIDINDNFITMRIGILTQPPHNNYGCILQAYALQTVLQQMGHEVCVFNTDRSPQTFSTWEIVRSFLYRLYSSAKNRKILPYYNKQKEDKDRSRAFAIKTQHTQRFVDQHINQYLYRNLVRDIKQEDFDAIVVGSDQVWRPLYSVGGLYNVYLKFATDWNIKRIGYAISFGTEEWEYNEEQTSMCKTLASRFDALSFREDSGVINCKKHFELNSIHVIDPTLLHTHEHYRTLCPQTENRPEVFSYVLDKNSTVETAVEKIAEKHTLTVKRFPSPDGDSILLPVEDWLQSIDRCKYVITDSFHGCVFSIIFNKPFWVIGNESRGLARFKSLLKTFQLQERLITAEELQNIDVARSIDWGKVNQIHTRERKRAIKYLKDNLL